MAAVVPRVTWLMFGAAEAGANTLSKLIDLKYKSFPQEMRTPYTSVLIDNIIEAIGKLLTLLKQQNESSIDPRLRRYLSTVTRAYLFYCKIPDEQKKPKIFTRSPTTLLLFSLSFSLFFFPSFFFFLPLRCPPLSLSLSLSLLPSLPLLSSPQ